MFYDRSLFVERPGEAVLCVLDLEAEGGEVVANLVGECPVLLSLGCLTLFQKHVDDGSVGFFAGFVGGACVGAKAEDVGDKGLHEGEQGLGNFGCDAGLLVDERVDDAAGVEEVADDDGGN